MPLFNLLPKSLLSSPCKTALKWPSRELLSDEPIFARPLKEDELDALQEEAGLGPCGWWLDPVLSTDAVNGLITPTYEDEVALTAWVRAPFECAGEIRDSSHGLLNRLSELLRLQNLAQREVSRRKRKTSNSEAIDDGKNVGSLYHSTLSLATSEVVAEKLSSKSPSAKTPISPSTAYARRGTYAVHLTGQTPLSGTVAPAGQIVTSSPKMSRRHMGGRSLVPPHSSKSPRRHDNKENNALALTYSKESLDAIKGYRHQTNNNKADFVDNDEEGLGLTDSRNLDIDAVSDVFSSVRGSYESRKTFNMQNIPPQHSSQWTVPGSRRLTYNNNANSIASNKTFDLMNVVRQQADSLRASSGRSDHRSPSGHNSLRGSNDGGFRRTHIQQSDAFAPRHSGSPARSNQQPHVGMTTSASMDNCISSAIQGSQSIGLTTLGYQNLNGHVAEVRSSMPTSLSIVNVSLKTSGSNSGSASMREIVETVRQQESELRASSELYKMRIRRQGSSTSLDMLNSSILVPLHNADLRESTGTYDLHKPHGSGSSLNRSLPAQFQSKLITEENDQSSIPLTSAGHTFTHNQSAIVTNPTSITRTPVYRKREGRLPSSQSISNLQESKQHAKSNVSLGNISSENLKSIVAQQAASLRASAEHLLKGHSKNSLTRSTERFGEIQSSPTHLKLSSAASYENVGLESSDRLKSEKPADDMPNFWHLAKQQEVSLRLSRDSARRSNSPNLNLTATSVDNDRLISVNGDPNLSSGYLPQVARSSASPVRMRKYPTPLNLPETSIASNLADTSPSIGTSTPPTAKLAKNADTSGLVTPHNPRPGSYTDQLVNSDTPLNAVDAWVSETMEVSDSGNDVVSSSIDCDSFPPALHDSADTEAEVTMTSPANPVLLNGAPTVMPTTRIVPAANVVERRQVRSGLRPPSALSVTSRIVPPAMVGVLRPMAGPVRPQSNIHMQTQMANPALRLTRGGRSMALRPPISRIIPSQGSTTTSLTQIGSRVVGSTRPPISATVSLPTASNTRPALVRSVVTRMPATAGVISNASASSKALRSRPAARRPFQ